MTCVDPAEAVVAELFDRDYYLARYPSVRASGVDPLEHFLTRGWRELRRPYAEFDVGWYIAAHLDPAAADEVNPLIHYALDGRRAGLATRPRFGAPREAAPLPVDARRAVLFAGYDRDGLLDETALAYLAELSRHAEVFYLSDGELRPGELSKLDGIAAGAWAVRHGAYDFGSYALLASELVGWDRIAGYDEVVLANDSCYLVDTLDEVFDTMSRRPCDWWGMQATEELASLAYGETRVVGTTWRPAPIPVLSDPLRGATTATIGRDMFERFPENEFHVGSYFIALRGSVLRDGTVQRFLTAARERTTLDKLDVVRRYEYVLTRLLISRGHELATFIDDLYPYHPMYTEWAFELLGRGLPLLKRGLLTMNPFGADLAGWAGRLAARSTAADPAAIDAHLRRTTDPAALADALARRADRDGRLSAAER